MPDAVIRFVAKNCTNGRKWFNWIGVQIHLEVRDFIHHILLRTPPADWPGLLEECLALEIILYW